MIDLDNPNFIVAETDDIGSLGYGPCIGVAIVWDKKGSLIHSSDPRMLCGEDFFTSVDKLIPEQVRSQLNPVVFGGRLDEDDAQGPLRLCARR